LALSNTKSFNSFSFPNHRDLSVAFDFYFMRELKANHFRPKVSLNNCTCRHASAMLQFMKPLTNTVCGNNRKQFDAHL